MSEVHNHSHEHSHSHSLEGSNRKALFFAFILILLFTIAEFTGGIVSKSLALLSDAGHMLTDVSSLGIALWAMSYANKKSNLSKTFGYKRIETISAFINGISLVVIAVLILKEGIQRLLNPVAINSKQLIIIASLGVVINIFVTLILMKSSKDSVNVRAAFLHSLGDLAGSFGAVIAGVIVMYTGWLYADPLISILIALLILFSSFRLLKETFHTLMEGTPKNINPEEICQKIKTFENVNDIHDLHIWSLNEKQVILTAHIIIEDTMASNTQVIIKGLKDFLHKEFEITHSTLEIETVNCDLNCN